MLAEPPIAIKAQAMWRPLVLLLLTAIALGPVGCRPQPEGTVKAVVIGSAAPKVTDPARGPLAPQDAVLVASVAQGLVSFDAAGNIVPGLAERWNVSDDGLSYIFRLANAQWPDKRKITAKEVVRLLKRQLASGSRNDLKDALGAVGDIVAMTDRVIEVQLVAPRPNFLSLLAQPEFAILRGNEGTGPFTIKASGAEDVQLQRLLPGDADDDAPATREQVSLSASGVLPAVSGFANGKADLELGGTFADLAVAQHVKLPRNALRFDPASGLFGLVPARPGGALDKPEIRRLLSQALDRNSFIDRMDVPGLAARATLLEPGLSDVSAPVSPAWFGVPLGNRLAQLRADADRLLGKDKPTIRVALPESPGGAQLLRELARDWGALGIQVKWAEKSSDADFVLIDEVAPSTSAAWFERRFRCAAVPVCEPQADELMNAARQTPVPAQRYALLAQAAARIDDAQLFIPITAPVRWSLVSARVQGFAGNRYASHTLTDLQQPPGRN
jgi:peptide/nickel transport system substrate-binding protein